MRKLIIVAAIAVVATAVVVPATASAGVKELAKQECRADRADDPAEFEARYGSGSAAIKRCAKEERREARVDRECCSQCACATMQLESRQASPPDDPGCHQARIWRAGHRRRT